MKPESKQKDKKIKISVEVKLANHTNTYTKKAEETFAATKTQLITDQLNKEREWNSSSKIFQVKQHPEFSSVFKQVSKNHFSTSHNK